MKNPFPFVAMFVALATFAEAEVWCDAPPPSPYDGASGLLPTQGSFDGTTCAALEARIVTPSATLASGDRSAAEVYENLVSQFFINMCHRRLAPIENGAPTGDGWYRDKFVRQLGPDMATGVTFGTTTTESGRWQTQQSAFHAPAVIWYNQVAFDWISVFRQGDDGAYVSPEIPMPDGAIIVKEMYPNPAPVCQERDPMTLYPENGIAFMVRDAEAT